MRRLRRLPDAAPRDDISASRTDELPITWPVRAAFVLAAAFLAVQVLLPLRHLAYPGNVRWNEEGYRFSWRVLVTEKAGLVKFRVSGAYLDGERLVYPDEYLRPVQVERMAFQPDMILATAHIIRDDFASRGHEGVEVRADALVAYNGREAAPLIDPGVDPAGLQAGIAPKHWVLDRLQQRLMTNGTAHPYRRRTMSLPPDPAARLAGLFLLLTAAATAVMVYARVAADADQDTLLESLHAIAANKAMYSLTGAARLVSGITLVATAWFLWKTWIIREGFGTRLVPLLFTASGAFTVVSGACAILLAAAATAGMDTVEASTETVALLRWLTGKASFAAAGLALLAAAQRQWNAGDPIRMIAPASAAIGIAMQLIWIDAATIMHRLSGVAFGVWLIVIGLMLVTGRVERHFAGRSESS